MNSAQAELVHLKDEYVTPLRRDSSDAAHVVMNLRHFHQELIEHGETLREGSLPFLFGTIYKNVTEDILRNCVEDDLLPSHALRGFIEPLAASLDSALAIGPHHHSGADWRLWGEQLTHFADAYRELLDLRLEPHHVALGGVKFLAASEGWQLPGLPSPRPGDDPHDPVFRLFPDLDATLTDPDGGPAIAQWYVDAVRSIQARLKEQGEELGTLCFVEKQFSVVGAVTLASHLVVELGIPATIFRAGYSEGQTRISGAVPRPGSRAVLLYDVAINGSVLQSAIEYLHSFYDVMTVGAIVLYDFELAAATNLADTVARLGQSTEPELTFMSYLRRSDLDRASALAQLQALPSIAVSSPAPASFLQRREEVKAMKETERSRGVSVSQQPTRADEALQASRERFQPIIEEALDELYKDRPDLRHPQPKERRAAPVYRPASTEYFRTVIEEAERDLYRDDV